MLFTLISSLPDPCVPSCHSARESHSLLLPPTALLASPPGLTLEDSCPCPTLSLSVLSPSQWEPGRNSRLQRWAVEATPTSPAPSGGTQSGLCMRSGPPRASDFPPRRLAHPGGPTHQAMPKYPRVSSTLCPKGMAHPPWRASRAPHPSTTGACFSHCCCTVAMDTERSAYVS